MFRMDGCLHIKEIYSWRQNVFGVAGTSMTPDFQLKRAVSTIVEAETTTIEIKTCDIS